MNPRSQVYGIDHVIGGKNVYSVYNNWRATPDRILNLVVFDGIEKLRRCELSDNPMAFSTP